MISLALSNLKPGSSPEASDMSPSAEAKGAKGAFSALLAGLVPQQADGDAEIAAGAGEPALPPANGTQLPGPAESGKNLPDIAAALAGSPAEVADHADDPSPAEADVPSTDAADPAPVPQVPVTAFRAEAPVVRQATPANHAAHPSPAAPGRSSLPLPALTARAKHHGSDAPGTARPGAKSVHAEAQAPSAAAELSLPAAALLTPARRESGETAEAISVATDTAPAADVALQAAALLALTPRDSSEAAAVQVPPVQPAPAAADAPLPAAAPLAPTRRESGETATAQPVATQAAPGPAAPAAVELPLPAAALLAPARRENGETAKAVAIHVAPEPAAHSASSQLRTEAIAEVQPAKVRETAIEGLPAARAVAADPASQAPLATSVQPLAAEGPQTARPAEIARPALHSDALQDLTRVVERLAAARDAFAPAAAALSVRHDEFGDLSLNFDQQRDGQLAVRLSAADPDAHRAIAAALGERSAAAATTADSQSGSGQSQGQARGAAAERDASGGNSAQRQSERHEQAQQRRAAANGSRQGSGDAPRAGIFA